MLAFLPLSTRGIPGGAPTDVRALIGEVLVQGGVARRGRGVPERREQIVLGNLRRRAGGVVPLPWILSGDRAAAVFTGLLVALIVAVRVVQRRQRSEYGPVEFYELPAASQRLDLTA